MVEEASLEFRLRCKSKTNKYTIKQIKICSKKYNNNNIKIK